MDHTEQHILVCLSSAPSNEKIVRTAANMAAAFRCQFTALYVETPVYEKIGVEDKQRLSKNRILAESLGAKTETVYGEDVAYQIAEFARLANVTQIVVGRSAAPKRHLFGRAPLTEQLIFYAPGVDIHIIPDEQTRTDYQYEKVKRQAERRIIPNMLKSGGILLAATVLCFLFDELGFTDANIIMVYILGVLLIAVVTSSRIYSMASSIVSVFIFNFLFTTPRFSFSAYETGYPVTFGVMFLTAFITATLAGQYKEQAKQSAKVAYRTKIVFDTNQLLTKAKDKDKIIDITSKQLEKLLRRKITIVDSQKTDKNDLPGECYKLQTGENVYGWVYIEGKEEPLDAAENSILLSVLGECALALENRKNAEEKEAAAILAKSEQLRANLLRTISHDLRTPLTSISGNASNLLNNEQVFDAATKKQLYHDIYKDSLWLINLVENLLSATRIEEGRMKLRTSTELLNDIIEEAMEHICRKEKNHQISAVYKEEFILVRADARLIVQVIANLLDNAIKYTQDGSEIKVIMQKNLSGMAEVLVTDNGPGIPDEEKIQIFDKFYHGKNKIADNRRSLGLGLYLCKSIIEAHGGEITVKDRIPHGTIFSFTLPAEEVDFNEQTSDISG